MALAVALAALAGLASAPALAETRPGYGGAIIGSLLGEPVEIDPVRARSHAETTLVSLLFDTLYRPAQASAHGMDEREASARPAVVPHVAAALPEVSPDGLTARISIRPGIVFHNGIALTANDVARSLRRVAASSEAGWLLAPVRSIDSAEGAVVIQLRRPAPDLAMLLAASMASITPDGAAPRWRRVIGSGPFRLETVDRKRGRILLTAANQHFAGRPYLNQLELRWFERADDEATAYEAGKAHLSLRGAVAYAGHEPTYRTTETAGPATVLAFAAMCASAAERDLGDMELRRALSLALDRNGFRSVGTGEQVVPAVQPVPLTLNGPAASTQERAARLADAKAALARAARNAPRLAAALAGRQSLTLEVLIDRSRPDDREVAEKVVAALFRLGVSARIADAAASEHAERVRRGNCDLYIGQLGVPVPAPELVLAAAFHAGNDRWAGESLARAPLDLAAAQAAFARRLPIVPLFHRAVRVHHRTSLRGVRMDDSAHVPFADVFVFGRDERSP